MRWGENETCIFVKLYLSHRCLWDPECEENKSKFHKDQAYQEIITRFRNLTDMEMDTNYVRIKIRAIRSTYSQELAKIRDRSEPNRPFKPSLKWFYIMHNCFANKGRKLKQEFLSGDDQQDTVQEDSSQKVWLPEEPDTLDGNDDVDKDPFLPQADQDYMMFLKSEPKDENVGQKERKYRKPKRKFKHRCTSSDVSEAGDVSHSVNSFESEKDDEFDIYGKYIASQLRGMDLQRALRVQLEIQRLVSDARMNQMINID